LAKWNGGTTHLTPALSANLFWSAAVLGRSNVQSPTVLAKTELFATLDTAAPEDGRAPIPGSMLTFDRQRSRRFAES
jgi:hypothetical protein